MMLPTNTKYTAQTNANRQQTHCSNRTTNAVVPSVPLSDCQPAITMRITITSHTTAPTTASSLQHKYTTRVAVLLAAGVHSITAPLPKDSRRAARKRRQRSRW